MRKNRFLLFLIFISLMGCSSKIVRWPLETPEFASQKIDYNLYADIFDEFTWTYPPLSSSPMNFVSGKATVTFKNKPYSFTNDNGTLYLLSEENKKTALDFKLSQQKRYSDINDLKLNQVTKSRWVPRTVYVHKMVSETKMVAVIRYRTVPVNQYANGRTFTTYKNESYTAYENQTRMVSKYVPETKWVWENYTAYELDIPDCEYTDFQLEGITVTIYRKEENGNYVYSFQNSSYLEFGDSKSVFYKEDCKTLILDLNSDGFYFDESDRILFNTWNPYDKNSHYKSIKNYVHNKWLPQFTVCRDLSFCLNLLEESSQIEINYDNSDYIDEEAHGEFLLHNIPENTEVHLNGKLYKSSRGVIKKEIEYGKYRLAINSPGFLDYEEYIVVNSKNPVVSMDFPLLKKGGKLNIENLHDKGWFLIVKDSDGHEQFFSERNELFLPEGEYTVTIHSHGFEMSKDINISNDKDAAVDYQAEIDSRAEKLM